MNFVKYNFMTKNGKELILEDNRVVVLIINDCIGVLSEAAGVIDSCRHARSSSAVCRSTATWRSPIVLMQAVSFVLFFSFFKDICKVCGSTSWP